MHSVQCQDRWTLSGIDGSRCPPGFVNPVLSGNIIQHDQSHAALFLFLVHTHHIICPIIQQSQACMLL